MGLKHDYYYPYREGKLENLALQECEKVEENRFFLQKFDMQIVCVLAAGLRFFDGGERKLASRVRGARGHSKLRPRPWPRTRNLLRAAPLLPNHTWATRECVGQF